MSWKGTAPLPHQECQKQYFSEKEDHFRLQMITLHFFSKLLKFWKQKKKQKKSQHSVRKTAAQIFSAAQQNPLAHILMSKKADLL